MLMPTSTSMSICCRHAFVALLLKALQWLTDIRNMSHLHPELPPLPPSEGWFGAGSAMTGTPVCVAALSPDTMWREHSVQICSFKMLSTTASVLRGHQDGRGQWMPRLYGSGSSEIQDLLSGSVLKQLWSKPAFLFSDDRIKTV